MKNILKDIKGLIIVSVATLFFACATTEKILVNPVKYEPSMLEKNPTKISYYIDQDLKNLTETQGTITVYEIFLGDAIEKNIKDVLEKIFYNPIEVSTDSVEGVLIKFSKANSKIEREVGSNYSYTIEINMKIFKNKKLIKEVNFTGSDTQFDRNWKIGETSFVKAKEQVATTCSNAIGRLCYKIGEYLMNYKFE